MCTFWPNMQCISFLEPGSHMSLNYLLRRCRLQLTAPSAFCSRGSPGSPTHSNLSEMQTDLAQFSMLRWVRCVRRWSSHKRDKIFKSPTTADNHPWIELSTTSQASWRSLPGTAAYDSAIHLFTYAVKVSQPCRRGGMSQVCRGHIKHERCLPDN